MRFVTGIVILFSCALAATAETVAIDGIYGLGDTRYHRIEREGGKPYHLLVRLPVGYDESDTQYPTIYILDGGALYPMLSAYYNYLRNGEDAPDLMLVGVSYGTNDWQNGNDRNHDYTAPSDEREYYGGAAEFQAFLADDVMPLIEDHYRSHPQRRVIFGQSLGGQFVLYTAQTRPDLFWGHIASNPALHRNLPLFLEMEPGKPESPSHLFVASASNDNPIYREPALEWIEHWTNRDSVPWRLEVETLDGHNHFSAPPASFRAGIRWLFESELSAE